MRYILEPTYQDLLHYGKGHDDSPPGRGSGRFPWGSGKKGKKPVTPKNYNKKKTKAQSEATASNIDELSNEELKKRNERMRLEQEYARLANPNKKTILDDAKRELGQRLVQTYVGAFVGTITAKVTLDAGKEIVKKILAAKVRSTYYTL